jgi:hypothetical protein
LNDNNPACFEFLKSLSSMIRVVNVEKDEVAVEEYHSALYSVNGAFGGDVRKMMNQHSLGITIPTRSLCGDVEEVSRRLCLDPSHWNDFLVCFIAFIR